MLTTDAMTLARNFLAEHIKLSFVASPPSNLLYGVEKGELVFQFSLFNSFAVGSSQFVAVSPKTGLIRFLGEAGE